MMMALLSDVVEAHILTRLDGPTLAAAACSSSRLNTLSTQQKLWQSICASTWPSLADPRLQTLASAYHGGHRSFFSDSFPVLDSRYSKSDHIKISSCGDDSPLNYPTKEIISAVDIYYQDDAVFSRVTENETVTGWFHFSPFRIDLVDAKDPAPTKIPFEGESNALLEQLKENLTLSWIIVDPSIGSRRAVNLSSRWPVSVHQDWLTRDVHVKYAVPISNEGAQLRSLFFPAREYVECEATATLGRKEGDRGGETSLYVKEVNMQMRDMDGRNLSGRDSLVILQKVMKSGKRKRLRKEEVRERHETFLQRKMKRKEKMEMVERVLSNVCLAFVFVMIVVYLSFKVSYRYNFS